MKDILFRTDEFVFSYRVAGVCVRNGSLLVQKPENDTGFALPGGHAAFGETSEETLAREFLEEIGADIAVGDLMWVGEIFFPWGEKPCHQICLFYQVTLIDASQIPQDGSFFGKERAENRDDAIVFYWIPLADLSRIEIYPPNAGELLKRSDQGVQRFVYRENGI